MIAAQNREQVHTEGVPYFEPEQYLVNIVRRAKLNGQDILVSAGTLGDITVLGSRREYVANSSDLPAFCRTPANDFDVSVLPRGARGEPERRGRSLGELMWEAAFHASDGRLVSGCSPVDVVKLTRWPNLSRLSRDENTVRLCALLTRHPTSIVVAGRLLKVEPAELYRFYSAACCAELTRPVNRQAGEAEEPTLAPYRNRNLLSKLVARLTHT